MRKSFIFLGTTIIILSFIAGCAAQTSTESAASPDEAPAVESQQEPVVESEPAGEPEVEIVAGMVTSTENEGPGSLREMIQQAQPGDTITFSPDVFPADNPAAIHLSGPIGFPQGGIAVDASNAGVIVDGEGGPESGFVIESGGNRVMGIKFTNFAFAGVVVKAQNWDSAPETSADNMIGGDRSVGEGPYGQGNCFGNNGVGINIQNGADRNQVTGNLIGIDADGSDIGNRDGGILVQAGADDNLLGPDNIIANNNEYGVMVDGSERVTVTQNSIFNYQNSPLILTNGGNREMYSKIEPESVDINCSRGTIQAEIYPSALMSVEVFSGDGSGSMYYEGSLDLDGQPNESGDDVRTTFTFDKGEAFQGNYLYFSGLTTDKNTTTFSDAVACGAGLENVSEYLDNPRVVLSDTFVNINKIDKWYTEFPPDAVGGRVEDDHFVLDNPDGSWRIARTSDRMITYLNEAGESGSQAVLMTFQYSGEQAFRIQASVHPESNPDYIYETGVMFDNGPQIFVQSPDENILNDGVESTLTIRENVDYQFLLALDDASGEMITAIWEKENPQNKISWREPINPDMVGEPWNFVVWGYSVSQMRIDDFQIIAFGQ